MVYAGIDGSHNSMVAAGVGARLASGLGAGLGLVQVLDAPVIGYWGGVQERMVSEIRQEAEAELAEIARRIGAACQVSPGLLVEVGDPVDAFPRLVEGRPDTLLVVVGRRGLEGERGARIPPREVGHLGEQLIRRLRVPVVLVPSDVHDSHLCPVFDTPDDAG